MSLYNAAGLVASTIEGTTGTFSGDVAVDTNVLKVDTSNNRVGINVGSPTEALDVTGTIKASADIEIGGNGDVSGRLNANLTAKVQNETGSTLSKGSPVYISATHSSGRPQVSLTDADTSTNKFPAIGLVYADISTGSQGYALTSGIVEDVPASLFTGANPSAGDTVYISATEGKITVDRPSSATVSVQNIGRIVKTNVNVSGNSGTAHILVQGSGIVHDIPNDIGDDRIIAAASATNYTPSASTVEGHLAGIDSALGSVDSVRTVTAGGNTLAASETLAFTEGTNITISESAGAVTINAPAQAGIEDADSDTKIQVEESNDEDIIRFDTAGTERMTLGSTGILTHFGAAVFNENGGSVDFRVEGDTDTHLLFVDGSADKVGISTSSPVATLDVDSGKTFRATRLLTVSLSTTTNLTESAHGGRYVFVTGSSTTINLPATHAAGLHFTLLSNDANGFTLASSDNMNGAASDITVDARNGVTCISDGTDWVVLGA